MKFTESVSVMLNCDCLTFAVEIHSISSHIASAATATTTENTDIRVLLRVQPPTA
jgi:hypothetical protein